MSGRARGKANIMRLQLDRENMFRMECHNLPLAQNTTLSSHLAPPQIYPFLGELGMKGRRGNRGDMWSYKVSIIMQKGAV